MADRDLITAYRHDLLSLLPAELAEEVCDGLTEAHEQYLRRGLDPDQAAAAAIAEFGEPGLVVESFRRACPVWSVARGLLVTGPIVGGCWAAALVAGRAWDWPIPILARLLVGLVLTVSVALLATAMATRRYQSLRRAGIAGCLGIACLDAAVIITTMVIAPGVGWLFITAVCVSTTRMMLVAGALRRLVATSVGWRGAS